MKKLMTALAVCLAAGFVAAAPAPSVTSSNIVGYVKTTATGPSFSTGCMFVSVGSPTAVWRLGDVTVSGMDPSQDNIQFLNTIDASTELTATYIDTATSINYVGDTSIVGWWDFSLTTSLDNVMVGAGTGFLCNFASPNVIFTYAGEVLQGSITLDLSGLLSPMIANFTPVDLTLGQLTVAGMDPSQDNIQFLNTVDASTDLTATYIDSATSISYVGDTSLVGWWDFSLTTSLDSHPLPTGTAFLGSFASPNVTITFPNPML